MTYRLGRETIEGYADRPESAQKLLLASVGVALAVNVLVAAVLLFCRIADAPREIWATEQTKQAKPSVEVRP